MNTATRPFAFLLLLLLASGPASAGLPEETAPAESLPRVLLDAGSAREAFDSYIVYYRNDAAPGEEKARAAADARKAIDRDLARVGAQLALDVRRERRLATGGHLLRLSAPLGKAASRAFMEAMANNPAVEFIEPNARRRALAVPNDSRYAEQPPPIRATGTPPTTVSKARKPKIPAGTGPTWPASLRRSRTTAPASPAPRPARCCSTSGCWASAAAAPPTSPKPSSGPAERTSRALPTIPRRRG